MVCGLNIAGARWKAINHLRKQNGIGQGAAREYIDKHFPQKLPINCPCVPKVNIYDSLSMDVSGTERAVVLDIAQRQQHGIRKYGKTVAQNPLTELQWLQHLYEELLDGAIYAKRLIQIKTDVEKSIEDAANARGGY